MAILYKPKFCCECGEKVERAEWRPWTNRRFCEFCETEFQGEEIARRAFAGVGTLAIAAVAFGFYGAGRLTENQSSVVPSAASPSIQNENIGDRRQGESSNRVTDTAPTPAPSLAATSSVPVYGPASDDPKPVYYCGALTRKGTACTRRVKEKGHRCWQHSASLNHEEISVSVSK